jgi:branched-subunit amino acid ABC-type transport system permease component
VSRFLQYAATGLAGGFATALLALGVVMIYRSTRVLSFAQGAIASLATYVFYQLGTVWKWPAWVALSLTIVAAVAIGLLVDLLAMRLLRRADALTRTVGTLGVVLVILVIIRVGWQGGETFVRPLSTSVARIGSFTIGVQQLITAAVAIAAAVALVAWTRRSYTGLGLSAIAEDVSAARLLGVSPAKASAITWVLASVLAALAGILVTPLLVLNPFQMTLLMVTSYAAALLGGFMSLGVTLLGAVAVGAGESVMTGYVNVSGLPETLGFIAVFAVLMLSRGRRGAAAPSLARGSESW